MFSKTTLFAASQLGNKTIYIWGPFFLLNPLTNLSTNKAHFTLYLSGVDLQGGKGWHLPPQLPPRTTTLNATENRSD